MDQESSSIQMVFFKFVFFKLAYFSNSRCSSKIYCFEQISSKLVEWNTVFDHYDLVFRQNIYFVIKSYANNFESKCHLQGRLPLDTKVKWITFDKKYAFYVALLYMCFLKTLWAQKMVLLWKVCYSNALEMSNAHCPLHMKPIHLR